MLQGILEARADPALTSRSGHPPAYIAATLGSERVLDTVAQVPSCISTFGPFLMSEVPLLSVYPLLAMLSVYPLLAADPRVAVECIATLGSERALDTVAQVLPSLDNP